MPLLKRNGWKVGNILVGMLLLMFIVWAPLSVTRAQEISQFATPVTAQATPTIDATVTALNKEKLAEEVQQLKNQNENQNNWFANNATALIAAFTTLVVALFGIFQWAVNKRDERQKQGVAQDKELQDRQAEREKLADQRFQIAVEGLSGDREEAKIGAAITLRTFLRPGYEQFYRQVFDLAVAHLCPSANPALLEDLEVPLTLTTLRQALIVVFKEAFPLARSQNAGCPQALDASYIQLDNAYLEGADLKQAWLSQASLRKAYLWDASLTKAYLRKATLTEAGLVQADLREADLAMATLKNAVLTHANLSNTDLLCADLSGAKLFGANFTEARLHLANLSGAVFGGGLVDETNLSRANLSKAVLIGTNIEDALLKDTNLIGVTGLTKQQLQACKAKGAIVDEDTTTHSPQASTPTPQSSQSKNVQASVASSTQGSKLTPASGEGNSAEATK